MSFAEQLKQSQNLLDNLISFKPCYVKLPRSFLENLISYNRVNPVKKLFWKIVSQEKFIDCLLDLLVSSIKDEHNEFENVIEHLIVFVSRVIRNEQ